MALVTVQITVESDDATPIPLADAHWTITENGGTTTVYDSGITDSSGETGDILLEDGTTYDFHVKKPYVSFSTPFDLVVAPTTDPQVFSFDGTYDPPDDPTALETCTIYGELFNPDGSPYALQAVIVDNVWGATDVQNRSVMGKRADVLTNSNGYFEVEAFRGATVRITIQGTRKSFRVVIPDQDTVDIRVLEAAAEDEIQDVVRG